MNKINEIMNIMNSINYGFLDKNGNNIFDDSNVEFIFNKVYYLMAPTELLTKKNGVCWDQVELERSLFEKNNIRYETYFIYIDDVKYLPSHTFLVFYIKDSVYWFEHSWYDEIGIHEYDNINDLLNDVEDKFKKSREKEVDNDLNTYIYKYDKPKYNISCDEFYKYIFTQKKVINYKLVNATKKDLERIKNYKFKLIMEYASNLSDQEINDIKNYICKSVLITIDQYSNIIYNKKIIGSFLIRDIDDGLLLDEIFIEKQFRSMGLGSSIINKIMLTYGGNIYLWVYKDNMQAFKLYSKLGFKVKEQTESKYYMIFAKK